MHYCPSSYVLMVNLQLTIDDFQWLNVLNNMFRVLAISQLSSVPKIEICY